MSGHDFARYDPSAACNTLDCWATKGRPSAELPCPASVKAARYAGYEAPSRAISGSPPERSHCGVSSLRDERHCSLFVGGICTCLCEGCTGVAPRPKPVDPNTLLLQKLVELQTETNALLTRLLGK